MRAPRLTDAAGRPLRDLRISVTDRCNFRCGYCMPREHFGPGVEFLPCVEILTFEEIARIAGVFVSLGVRKLRLTGGEPLLRNDLPRLVQQLAAIPGVDLALTTNGSLLEARAGELARAGLGRVTVSLDSLDEHVFRAMVDTMLSPADVLAGIDAASCAGLAPIKINAVVRRGMNDGQHLVDLARRFKGTGHVVRFVEYMDVGSTNGWRVDEVVSGREIIETIARELPLEPISPSYRGEVAERWRYRDGDGEIGVIRSVTAPFCDDCSRARLSPEGTLYTCLFATHGADLRAAVRSGSTDAELTELVRAVWARRSDCYSQLRTAGTAGTAGTARLRRIEMSHIGG